MKGLRAKDIRGNDPSELERSIRKLEQDLFKYRMKKTTNQLENVMLIRNTRREIARVHTVLAERARQDRAGTGGAIPTTAGGAESETVPQSSIAKKAGASAAKEK